MIWLALAGLLIVASFAAVIPFGAPYVPTLTPQVMAALELVNLKPGETLLELGCGDGKVLIAAAQTGIRAVGYELNPIMALIAWARTRRYKGQVRVVWGNVWRQDWPPAEGIFTFLLGKYMPQVDSRIEASSYRPVKLVSFAFEIPGKQASRQKDGIFLYDYR